MTSRRLLRLVVTAALVAAGCGGSQGDTGLLQDGPTLRTVAADGTLVVEGRVFNLSERPLDGAQVEITVRRVDQPPVVLSTPLGDGGAVGAFETVSFRVETGIRADPSAQVSVTFTPADAP